MNRTAKSEPQPPSSPETMTAVPYIHHDRTEDFSIYQPAGLMYRWYALTLDITLVGPVDLVVRLPFQRYLERLQAFGQSKTYFALWGLLYFITLLMMVVAPTVLWGQTLGKKIVGVRVVSTNFASDLTIGMVFFRELVAKPVVLLVTLGLGFLMAGVGPRKRALHDFLAGTHVIRYRIR